MDYEKSEITKMLEKENREKKRTAIGVFKRASRRGYLRGGMKTPYDFMTKAEKDCLNGEVVCYNLNNLPGGDKMKASKQKLDSVWSIEELHKMMKEDPHVARNYIIAMRKKYKNTDLMNHWGLNEHGYYNKILHPLEILKSKKKENRFKSILPNVEVNYVNSEISSTPVKAETPVIEPIAKTVEKAVQDQMQLYLVGEFGGKELISKIENVALFINEDERFKVEIRLTEASGV